MLLNILNKLNCIIEPNLNEHLDLSSLPGFPEVPGDVEEDGLEEQGETDPLVVFVISNLKKKNRNSIDVKEQSMGKNYIILNSKNYFYAAKIII